MEKPGFGNLRKTGFPTYINQPAAILSSIYKSCFPRLFVSERNPVLVVKLIIIILSDGKTGFRNLDAIAISLYCEYP
jgi:hypothetical protein